MAVNNEATFDLFINNLLDEVGITHDAQGSSVKDINNALKTASKNQDGNVGKPEYIAVIKDFVLVIEDKRARDKLVLRGDDNKILLSPDATMNYAVNGALFYAQKILEGSSYKKVFAFGCVPDNIIKPVFVDESGYKELEEVKNFENFNADKIINYYKREVLNERPEQKTLEEILKCAKTLHKDLRNYGQLGDAEKPLVVSAILLALREKKHGFNLYQLTGDDEKTDGEKLFDQIQINLRRAKVAPQVKLERVLNQFTLIKDRPQLNNITPALKKTPLKYFAEFIDKSIFDAAASNSSPEDYLGRFYGEFISYSGGDGQTLGVVLTPSHICELFCDLVDLKPDDVIFDPCCGTGGFLIAGMHKMLDAAKDDETKNNIKSKQIHGIEIRDDMFSIATTNMILRGDGQSNLICENFFNFKPEELKEKNITVGFMNPPYSQATNESTAHLSELNFISHLLDCVNSGGRAAVIVPLSAMIGKTKSDKFIKADILKRHTLEGVITLNTNTFYGVGTNPCIAVFKTGEPHNLKKLVKFINFEDDGYVVKKHLGLVKTERADDRKSYLLDCWHGYVKDAPSKFMIETVIKPEDEWLHSFYYYNAEIPSEQSLINSIADYLTFEFSMITHGRGYLFGESMSGNNFDESDGSKKNWREFRIGEMADIISGRGIYEDERITGDTPYISASAVNNGVSDFLGNANNTLEAGCISVNSNGSIGYAFYHPYSALYSGDCKKLRLYLQNKFTALFVAHQITEQREKYDYGYKMNAARIKHQKILLPATQDGKPDYAYMENYVKEREQKLLRNYIAYADKIMQEVAGQYDLESLANKCWGEFKVGELFKINIGKAIDGNKIDKTSGRTAYITRKDTNNGLDGFIDYDDISYCNGNYPVITIGNETAEPYVQVFPFYTGTKVNILSPKEDLSRYSLLFIAESLRVHKYKYSYSYTINSTRLQSQKILLPVDANNQPDYLYMENFVKAKIKNILENYLKVKLI